MPTLLFDIDGTLIRSGGAGKLAMERGLRHAFGLTQINDTVPYAGRTDRGIGYDLLQLHGVPTTEANFQALQQAYLEALPASLEELGGTICPGVPELLEQLRQRADVHLGLLTGNAERGARIKLEYFQLWQFFRTGGFGDNHTERNGVARAAVAAMQAELQRELIPHEVWIIGDTPLDISCARHVGAKAVAVATGWHEPHELTEADYLFEHFAEPNQFLALL